MQDFLWKIIVFDVNKKIFQRKMQIISLFQYVNVRFAEVSVRKALSIE